MLPSVQFGVSTVYGHGRCCKDIAEPICSSHSVICTLASGTCVCCLPTCTPHCAEGHGLDWIWPYLLGYPQDRIAVIDEVCVIHPRHLLQRRGKVSMYDINPAFSWQTEEEGQQFDKFGYAAKVHILFTLHTIFTDSLRGVSHACLASTKIA